MASSAVVMQIRSRTFRPNIAGLNPEDWTPSKKPRRPPGPPALRVQLGIGDSPRMGMFGSKEAGGVGGEAGGGVNCGQV